MQTAALRGLKSVMALHTKGLLKQVEEVNQEGNLHTQVHQ